MTPTPQYTDNELATGTYDRGMLFTVHVSGRDHIHHCRRSTVHGSVRMVSIHQAVMKVKQHQHRSLLILVNRDVMDRLKGTEEVIRGGKIDGMRMNSVTLDRIFGIPIMAHPAVGINDVVIVQNVEKLTPDSAVIDDIEGTEPSEREVARVLQFLRHQKSKTNFMPKKRMIQEMIDDLTSWHADQQWNFPEHGPQSIGPRALGELREKRVREQREIVESERLRDMARQRERLLIDGLDNTYFNGRH